MDQKEKEHLHPIQHVPFQPLVGMSSPHVQTVLACFSPTGIAPPSTQFLVTLSDGDHLCYVESIPRSWQPTEKTIVLIHGLGGDHTSSYMVRLSRKLYKEGFRVIRVNLRSCGLGSQYASRPYHGGVSADIFELIKNLKLQTPLSPIMLIGFSLGGNIALKLAGELGENANEYVDSTIAVCPPVNLADTAELLSLPANRLYNLYYMRQLEKQAERWTKGRPFSNIYEFDNLVTAPEWNFQGPFDYYRQSSSCYMLSKIRHPCHLLFAADDPFINYQSSFINPFSPCVKVWLTPYGGHMGFFGWTDNEYDYFWLDNLLLKWVKGNF